MAIQLTPISSKYFSEIKNGTSFSLNTGDFGTHLKGTPGERMKAEITVQISWRFDITTYDITNTNTITLQSGSVFADSGGGGGGFSIGDTANITFRGAPVANHTFTVVSISSDGKQMVTSGAVLPNGGFGASTYDTLRGLTPLEGLKYKFNFIGNDDTTTFISILDETTMAYKTDGIRTAFPTPVVSTWDDTIIGSQTGNHQVSFVQDVSDGGIIDESGGVVVPLDSIQEFKIEHEFIVPYYLDGELINLQTLIRPERIEAGISLKPVIDFEFRSTLSNPNTAKTGRLDTVLGQTSYFNENFGDESTQYSITNVVLSSGEGIDSDNITNLQFSVLSANASFVTAHPVVAYHSKLPVTDEYVDKITNFETNFIYESLRATIDGAPVSGTIFSDLDVDLDTASKIDVSVNLELTAAQKLLIDEGDDYFLSFGVADDSLTTDLSDKAILKVNLSQYTKNLAVSGLMANTKFDFFTHVMPFVTGLEVGYTGLEAWVQDGIMINWGFTLDRTLNAVLERFRIRMVALNTADETFFPLTDVEYDLSGVIVTPGTPTTQQIEIDESLGFPLAEDSIFNLKTFTTGTYSAPNQPYTGQTAFKIAWQEWLSLPGANAVFYDPSEPNDGLNQKASQYSLKEGYEIRFLMDADVSVDGASVTNYRFNSPEATIRDFEEQDGSPITWTPIKETFDLDGANINQEILTNEKTRVQITFVPDAVPGLASLYWGLGRIEEVNQPGDAVCEISTLNYRPSKKDNILTPLEGDTEASLSLDSGNLVLEFLINNDSPMFDPAKKYNVYGRMGQVDQDEIILPTVKVAISGTTNQDDGDIFVFLQNEIMASSVLKDNFFNSVEGDYVFKIGTVAQVGGAPFEKATWAAITAEPDFNSLAIEMATTSNRYVYIEQTDTSYKIEGLIIEFERLQSGQNNSFFTVVMPANSIDQDIKIWSDRKYDIVDISFSNPTFEPQFAVRLGDTSSEDWTEFSAFTPLASLVADINAVLLPIVDGTKHCLNIFNNFKDGSLANQVDFEVDYLTSEDFQKSMEVMQSEIRPEYRPFGKCASWGPFPNLDDPYATTDPLATPLVDLLDKSINNDPYSFSFWIQGRSSQGANDRVVLFVPFLLGNLPTTGGLSLQLEYNVLEGRVNNARVAQGSIAGLNNRWFGSYPQGERMHIVVTSDGSDPNLLINQIVYINGRKQRADQSTSYGSIGVGAQRPNDNMYYHGKWAAVFANAYRQPEKTERIQVFDKELTALEAQELYYNINSARGGSPTVPNLFRDWDFSAHAAGVVPELTGSGFDMAIVTGGAQPGNPDFY